MRPLWICDSKMEEPISQITLQINIPVLSLSLSLLLLLLGALAFLTFKSTYGYESTGHLFNDISIVNKLSCNVNELKGNMYILIQVAFMGRHLTVGGKYVIHFENTMMLFDMQCNNNDCCVLKLSFSKEPRHIIYEIRTRRPVEENIYTLE